MRITEASDRAVTILFSDEALPPPGAALALARQALAERGLSPWPDAEAEFFRGGGEALVIVRPVPPRRRMFLFPDLEALLLGASACPGGPSSLYAAPNGYLLALERDMVRPGLYEFGRETVFSPDWDAHAREQEQLLMDGRAVDDLRRFFST